MLQSIGSQGVRHELMTEQQQTTFHFSTLGTCSIWKMSTLSELTILDTLGVVYMFQRKEVCAPKSGASSTFK